MKSIRISIEPVDWTVKVSAPKRISIKQIQDFVTSKKTWIEKAQEHYAKSKELLQVGEWEILLHGIWYTITHYELRVTKEHYYVDHDHKTIWAKKDLTNQTNQTVFYKA